MSRSDAADRQARDRAPPPLSSREIRRWDTSGGEVVVVELQEYDGGRRVIAFRRWYRDGAGALRPGRNGLSFPLGDIDELESAVESLRALSPRPPEPADEPVEELGTTQAQPPVAALRPLPFPRILRPGALPSRPPGAAPVPARTEDGNAPPPDLRARVRPAPAPVRPQIPAPPPPARSRPLLAEIFAAGLVASPLGLRLDVRGATITGQAFSDGTLVFANRRFATPREAVAELRGQIRVVDAWQTIRYRNPQTNRFARLSRLRSLHQAMSEGKDFAADDAADDES